MKNTRFMERLFSATEERDEELTSQVAQDIEDAKANGEVDTEEINYKANGDGTVSITDKENGEVTVAEQGEDGMYDLYPAEVTEQIEGFLHPEGDGVTPGKQKGTPDEHVEDHPELEEGVAASQPNTRMAEVEAQEGPCPECCEGEECEEEVREFSVHTNNSVVLRVFSDQEFCERIFSEVIESEETAVVGDLKIEKVPGENAVVVTSKETGDQAKVDLDEDNMDVTELDSKNFCDGVADEVCMGEEQYLPLHVVGIDSFNHQLVDAVEYDEASAQELVDELVERGVDGVQVFDCPDAARDYAMGLLEGLEVEEGDVEEPEQVEFSYHENVYVTRFYSNHNYYMTRLFSESANDIDASQSAIEDAIENGDEIETNTEIITPIDATTAVVEDKVKGEYTKVTIEDEDMDLTPISEEEADELMDGLEVEAEGEDEEEKDFSDIWCNEAETKFFSEHEIMTAYMQRLFSEEADEEEIESAIEEGEQVETDSEIITPVDAETAVIEDKDNGEFTKATMNDDHLELSPISEEEADELMDGLETEEDEDEEEKEFSDIFCDEAETKFFSEHETMTAYMQRLFSEEADQDEIEDAIESGEQIENDTEVITPVDATTAVIEDKETGEFTKATIASDEDMNVEAISEEEADELTDGLAVEESEEDKKEADEKKFSNTLDKFFSEIPSVTEGEDLVAKGQAMIEEGQAMIDSAKAQEQAAAEGAPTASVEEVEDKAQAAINAIQNMLNAAQQGIEEAKNAPVETENTDLREAQFSDNFDSKNDQLLSWLGGINK